WRDDTDDQELEAHYMYMPAVVNSPQPIYDQEPSMVDDDEDTSKEKEIDKLMALISLSFKKIYKPTNNNLRTSSNTNRANQDNFLRIYRNAGYESQRSGTVAEARDTVGSSMVQKSGIQCYNCKEYGHVSRECQKPKRAKYAACHREKMLLSHYMYMPKLQQVSPDDVDSRPVFDTEPEQKVQNDDHYDMFAIDCQHSEQSKSAHNTYLIEQDAQNVSIESMDMNYDSEQIDQNDEDIDLAKEQLEAHYMYMAKLQQVSPDAVDSGPIFDKEPEQKVQNDYRYDVFAIECQHTEQSESVHNTYLLEQDTQNVSIESVDMNYDSDRLTRMMKMLILPKNVSCLLL
nr:hypothetical protein [Tanacetum cinerariifolium]